MGIKEILHRFGKELAELIAWSNGSEYVYDIETYPNFWSCAVVHVKTLQVYYFELSEWYNNMDEFQKFIYHLNHHGQWLIGFNNFGYDWPVTDLAFRMIPAGVTNADIYNKSDAIINGGYENRFDHVIWPGKQIVRQIDLFKINHYDNPSKATSLKMLENNMYMDNIQELPVTPGKPVNRQERDGLAKYNIHDIAATLLALHKSMAHIDLRRTLTEKFNHDFMNASDAKIGADIFKLKLREAGLPTDQKTYRDEIKFSECLFDYVWFERPEFRELHAWILNTTVKQTKEALNNIDVPYSLVQYMNPVEVIVYGATKEMVREDLKRFDVTKGVKLSDIRPGTYVENLTFVATHLHVVVDGFQFDLGTGGIHGSITSQIVRTSDTHQIVDVDVASYYPNLGIKNRIYPAHLGEPFCDIKEGLYETRKTYNKKTHPMENKAFKLAMNAAYGNSNNKHSFLFDSKYTMTITLNGQLLLCMLAEQLLKVPGLTLVQINTDGVTYRTPIEYKQHTLNLCRWWESITKLELEDVDYKAMYIRDVNNYIAETMDGSLKRKGAYEHAHAKNGDWHKNFDCLIVPLAAEEALVRGGNVREFIESKLYEPENRFLFCLKTKGDRSTTIVINRGESDEVCQRITRWYAAINGGSMFKVMRPLATQITHYKTGDHYQHEATGDYKVMKPGKKPPSGRYKPVPIALRREAPPRRIGVETTCLSAQCNDINEFDWNNLNVDWYINQVNKIVDPLL